MGTGGGASNFCPSHNKLLAIQRTFESLNKPYYHIHPNQREATHQRILRCNDHDEGSG